ncbi:uncharacterized protein LOC108738343 [Agrilus planipennis]|uniref:Uncharacterized protein LOC108738343 n=1 Tax=Agrilus planipennis TaxID=224129 RepID=A0A1W4WTK4_AGRPL|nr:uncharacterized protein LOC108738343 [Agrilus planipennis]
MFPTFISILDIQSWWEVPSIAHFCSLFRSSFNLLDFDIEDLEEALLTDGTEENSWLQELIVRLLTGCLPNNEISTFNYQMFLRRLFREKCKEHDRYNPFNTDIDFQLLPLRTKVDILYALCDFRLDADDVLEQLKNLEADSLRVEPLGYDDNDSAYWYFYGTRLYREDFKSKNKKGSKSVWQVICFTQEDWFQLAKKFKKSQSKNERHLYHTLTENFLPELPRLFHEKERLARKRLLESQPKRTSNRIETKKKQELEAHAEKNNLEDHPENKSIKQQDLEEESKNRELIKKRKESYRRRAKLRGHINETESHISDSEQEKLWKRKDSDEETEIQSCKSEKSESSNTSGRYEMARDKTRGKKGSTRQRKNSGGSCSGRDNGSSISRSTHNTSHRNSDRSRGKQATSGGGVKGSATTGTPRPTTTVGRQTNNSLAAATGQIVIQPVSNPQRKKLKTSQVFRQTEEDLQVGMHKILDYVKNHEDAWPFVDPVEEEYAPNYYSVIRKPMDLQRMEDRLDSGYYKTFSRFRADFQLIVDNCRLYNGVDNEYTEMVGNLVQAFEKGTEKYLDQISSSDEEIRIEYLTSESESKNSAPKKEITASSSTCSRRKPTLVAQTDKKRDRSSSVESIKKKKEIVENAPKVKTKNDTKEPSRVKELVSTKTKNLKSGNKTNEKHKKKTKKNSKNSKKSTKKNSRPGSAFSRSRSGSLVDRSMSRSPQNQRWSSSPPPPSWPPSPQTPKRMFDFELKNNSKRPKKFSDEEMSNSGKDKENKKDKWDEVFRSDPNSWDKKPEKPLSPQRPKDKHNKLRETIEKLKAKSEISKKYKDPYLEDLVFNNSVKENRTSSPTTDYVDSKKKKLSDNKRKEKKDKANKVSKRSFDLEDGNSTADSFQSESKNKKAFPKSVNSNTTKNATIEALTLATEQTLKDINKWLDDTPRLSEFSSASNSPTHYLANDEFESIGLKIEQDSQKKVEKPLQKKDGINKDSKKRSFSRDPTKFLKKREIQRTIDRLQPGKSKGNLLSNVQNTNKTDEVFPLGPISKNKDLKNSLIVKTDENAPKLSLGSVLDSFGKHKFVDDLKKEEESSEQKGEESLQISNDKQEDIKEKEAKTEKVDTEKAPDPLLPQKQVSPGKATPNLSAWFKAFGAPKVQPVQKKLDGKLDSKDDKTEEPKLTHKDEQRKVLPPESSPNSEAQGPALHGMPMPRQRKASTGSSVSERSSFSQDMDSPRVGIDERIGAYPAPYPSPLHKSPSGASPVMPSPRPDVSPKSAAYPTLNGQIRVGFYQDTVSTKSSPENPQSPYFSEHIYTPASMQNVPPNYSYNNSPYYPPNYSNSNPTPPYNSDGNNVTYYDTNKPLTDQYQAKTTAGYHQPLNSPNYQPSSNSPNYSSNPPNLQKNSPHYSPHSPSCNSVHSPNLSSGANSPLNSPNYQPSSNSPLNSPNYAPLSNSPVNSPNYPPPNSPGFNSANSPNYPAVNSPHSPANSSNFQSANSPGYQTNNSPSCQPVNSPGYQATNSPGYQASNSIASPHYQAANSPNYPAPNSPNYTMSNSPGYQQVGSTNYQNTNKNASFSSTSGFQRINTPDSPTFKPPTPTGFREPNSPLVPPTSPYPVHQEFDDFQQNKQPHSNIFPVKKRAFNDINSVPQHQETSLPVQQQNIFSNRNFDTNVIANQQINNEIVNQLQHSNQNTLQSSSQMKTTTANQFHQNHEMIQAKNVMSSSLQSNSALKETVLDPEAKRNVNFGSLTNLYGPGSSYPLNIPSARPLDLNARPESKTVSMQGVKTDPSGHYVDQLNSYGMPGNLQQSIMGQPRLGSEGLGNRLNSATGNYKPTELSNPYKNPDTSRTTFNTPTSLSAMEQSLSFQRNLATLSHIVDRFQSGERLLQGLQSTASYYSDKNLVSHVYTKPMTTTSASLQQMFSQSVNQYSGQDVQNSMFNRAMELHNSTNQPQQQVQQQPQPVTPQVQEKKSKRKKSAKAAASAPPPITEASTPTNATQGFQSYTGLKNVDPSAISLKASSVVPGSAFNFGPAAAAASSLGLSSGLYGEKDAYSNFLEEYRTTPNYYMAAAAAAHHRSTPEAVEKQARTAHQQPVTAASTPSYPFIGAPQPRPPSYPFMTPHQASTLMDPSSPLYQQYLQAGVLHQGLLGAHGAYPAGYHPALGMRQPFDSMTRPPWL